MNKQALIQKRSARRRAYVVITPELLLDLLYVRPEGERWNGQLIRVLKDAIPADATAIRCGITPAGNVQLILESSLFDEIEEGDIMFQLTPTYQACQVSTLDENNR